MDIEKAQTKGTLDILNIKTNSVQPRVHAKKSLKN
jgi:hypothetical protein